MGVKAIKEKYKIEHIVQKRDNVIWIGSPLASEIIGVNTEGEFVRMYKNRKYDDGWNTNEDLKRYQEEMIADKETGELITLINIEDDFDDLKTVFTYDKGRVIKTSCEVYGWPNTDIRGEIMYDNTYFKTYKQAYAALLKDTKLKYPWRNWRNNMKDSLIRMKNTTGYLLRDVFEYLYSRSIQRAMGIFYFLVK
jgi:hypothetical protein